MGLDKYSKMSCFSLKSR